MQRIFLALMLTFTLLILGCGEKRQQVTNAQTEQQQYQWKLVTSWPKNFPGLGMAPERFAKLVDEMSAGQLHIQVYGAGELVPAFGVFDAVSEGAVQMGHSAAYYWKGKVPAAQFFTSIPFGMNAQQMNGWLTYGGGQALWEELYAPFNLLPLAGGNTGTQMGGWFNREINSIDDLQGLKMRIPGLGGDALKKLGGVPVTLPGKELFTALQTGTIDATEWVGPYNDLAFGFHKAAKFYYYPGWHEPNANLEFLINKTSFERLPAHLQVIVKTAAKAVNQDLLDEYTSKNIEALRALVEDHHISVRAFPQDVMDKLKIATKEAIIEQSAEDPMMKKVYQQYTDYLNKVREYHDVAESAYTKVVESP